MADTRNAVVLLNNNGANFSTWKLQCRMVLMKHGVWKIVNGTEVAPDENNIAATNKFNDRRDKALSTIVLAVDTSLLYLLGSNPEDPIEVWNKLCDQFQAKTWANKLALRRKLYGLKLRENQSVQDHLKAMLEIFDSLAVIGCAVEEEDRVVHILTSLPESYNMLVTALEACPEVPKLEIVTERLLNEERKIKEKGSAMGGFTGDALFVGVGSKKCYYCGKTGHIKKFCNEWKKKNEIEESENKSPAVANFSHHRGNFHADSDSDEVECIALISEVKKNDKNWIVDSAATKHLCNDKKSMTEFKKLKDPEQVKVGNGDLVEAKYEGCVKLRVKAGHKTRLVKLQNVLYVPEMKYNLLSVSRSATLDKKVEFVKSGCRIVDDITGETIATASKRGQLYYLDCIKYQENKNQKKKVSERREMEKALISVRENNFQEEMLKRLDSLEEDKINMELRLKEFKVSNRITESYSLKEENSQNQVKMPEVLVENQFRRMCLEKRFEESELEDSYDEDSESEDVDQESVEDSDDSEVEDDREVSCKNYEVEETEICNKRIQVSNVDVQEDNNEVHLSIDNQEDSNNDVGVQLMSPTPSVTPVGSQVDTHRLGFRKRLNVIKNRFSKMSRRCAVTQFLKKK